MLMLTLDAQPGSDRLWRAIDQGQQDPRCSARLLAPSLPIPHRGVGQTVALGEGFLRQALAQPYLGHVDVLEHVGGLHRPGPAARSVEGSLHGASIHPARLSRHFRSSTPRRARARLLGPLHDSATRCARGYRATGQFRARRARAAIGGNFRHRACVRVLLADSGSAVLKTAIARVRARVYTAARP